jgi:hypothetical protein
MATVHDSPTAAENYFNETIFGRLYTLMAEALATERVATGARDGRSLADRLDGWFWRRVQKDREAYLAASVDVFELERRIADLQRGAR